MNTLKTIGVPFLITCAAGVIIACYVFPAVLASALAITLPLLESLITDGTVLLWVLSFLQIVVLTILYVLALLLLLKWLHGKERLVCLSFAVVVSVSLLFMSRHVLHGILLSELIIEVLLIVAASLIILCRKTKQPVPRITINSNCPETGT